MSYNATAMIKVPPARLGEAQAAFLDKGIACCVWHASHGILDVGYGNNYSEGSLLDVVSLLKAEMNLTVWILGEDGLVDLTKREYRNGRLVEERDGMALLGIYSNSGPVEILE